MIVAFKYVEDAWVQHQNFYIGKYQRAFNDHLWLVVMNNIIYIFFPDNYITLYKFPKYGKSLVKFKTIRSRQNLEAGDLKTAFLCSLDKYGNVLVSDNYNLHVYDQMREQWNFVQIHNDLRAGFHDAIVSEDGQYIWGATVNSLDKYAMISC